LLPFLEIFIKTVVINFNQLIKNAIFKYEISLV